MMTNTAVIIRTDLSFQNAMLCRRPITHTSEQYLLVPIPKISYLLSIIKTEMTLNWNFNGSAEVYYHNFHCNLRFSSHVTSLHNKVCVNKWLFYGETISRPSDKTKKARTWFHLNHCNRKTGKIAVGIRKKKLSLLWKFQMTKLCQ